MKKCLGMLLGLLFVALLTGAANATVITTTFNEFSSPWHQKGTYYDKYVVGEFSFDLSGQDIVSARIFGTWGNSIVGTTAHNLLFVDDLQIADTHDYDPDPDRNPYVPWAYDFTDFSVLEDGFIEFSTVQTAQYNVRLSETTLVIETAPSPVPEPATMVLLGLGLAGLAGAKRKRITG